MKLAAEAVRTGSPLSETNKELLRQSWWTEGVHQARLEQLEALADARNTVRLQCIKSSLNSAWLQVCPSPKLNLKLLPSEFVILVKWWLGLITAALCVC